MEEAAEISSKTDSDDSLLIESKDVFVEHKDVQLEDDVQYTLSIDEYLLKIGQMGKFQILSMVIFSLVFIMPATQALVMVFISLPPDWVCPDNYKFNCENETVICNMSTPTSHSIVTQFNLVCTRDVLVHVANSGLFIGQIIGGFVFGWMSDRYGRKNPLFICVFGLNLFSFVISFSPNIWMFIAFRVVCGIFHGGVLVTIMAISIELVGTKYRALAGLIIWNVWTVALCFMSLQSWLIPEWRKLMIVLSAPYFFVPLIGFYWIPESVRWYRSQNKLNEAEQVFRKVASINGKPFPNNSHLEPVYVKTVTKSSFKDLFSSRKLAWKSFCLCFMWFTNDTIYYGISLAAGDFGGSLHRDFVFISLVEIPANLSTIFIINRIGRKKGCIVGYIVTVASLMTFGFLQACRVNVPVSFSMTFGILGKAFGYLVGAHVKYGLQNYTLPI